MELIVDSGATKAGWFAVEGREIIRKVKTSGMNFATMSSEAVYALILQARDAMEGLSFSGVHFYAAGLIEGSEVFANAVAALSAAFPEAHVECASDMLAAARAVCGHGPGIAAILGTGSNSCFFDGRDIVSNVRSGGFILGDEGGGACLGKQFLADYIKGLVPEPLASEFGAAFEVDYMTVVRRVYREEAPSAYLGSFAPWILERRASSGYVRSLVDSSLESFFDRSLMRYDRTDVPVGFIGSYAVACADIIRAIAARRGVRISRIIANPIEGLAEYHCL